MSNENLAYLAFIRFFPYAILSNSSVYFQNPQDVMMWFDNVLCPHFLDVDRVLGVSAKCLFFYSFVFQKTSSHIKCIKFFDYSRLSVSMPLHDTRDQKQSRYRGKRCIVWKYKCRATAAIQWVKKKRKMK